MVPIYAISASTYLKSFIFSVVTTLWDLNFSTGLGAGKGLKSSCSLIIVFCMDDLPSKFWMVSDWTDVFLKELYGDGVKVEVKLFVYYWIELLCWSGLALLCCDLNLSKSFSFVSSSWIRSYLVCSRF